MLKAKQIKSRPEKTFIMRKANLGPQMVRYEWGFKDMEINSRYLVSRYNR